SAYYGLPRKVNSINHAIVLLGFDTVRNLCLGVGVFRSFLPYSLHEKMDLERFWEHTIAAAVCSRMLRPEKTQEESEEIFLAALIHDIGRLCFLAAQPDIYLRLILTAKKEGLVLAEAEQNVFGGTHAKLGGLICRHWNFGPELTQPVEHHHEPEKTEPEYALRAAEVAVCNCIAQQRGMRWNPDAVIAQIPPFAMDALQLTEENVRDLGDRLEARRKEIESFTIALM
ncbi:MAG TPA: HDOD domain-containing protein, partial [Planctomycetota bacterium]|nr:HDOD domain-containing protein [Planctomycetota bacterium]